MLAQAKRLADQLTAAGVPATVDPAWAATNRPCVLVAPPTVDYIARSHTWQLAALSSHGTGTLASWDQLADLVDRVAAVLNAEAATPASYALTPDTGAVPAYLIRVTT